MVTQIETPFTLSQATHQQASILADLRVDAMRASLEAVGIFEPDAARARVLGEYSATETMCIEVGDTLAGFTTIRMRADHYYLDHLYISSDFQNQGLGSALIARMQASATQANMPILCVVLVQSDANRFYQRHGFSLTQTQEFDNYYLWLPEGLVLNPAET